MPVENLSVEVWEALARAEVHPTRISICEVLSIDGGRTLSPSELARELQATLSTVAYHTRCLGASGVLREVDVRPVRGATEHFYCLAGHSGDDLAERR